MLTLLGSLIGFGSSFLPKILSFIETREQNKQEIRLMEKQAELTRITAEFERDKAQVQALSAETVALYQADAAEAASLEKGSIYLHTALVSDQLSPTFFCCFSFL